MGFKNGPSDAIPTTPFKVHDQIEYRVKGRILHTTARGPFTDIVEAIPPTITGFIQRLTKQGRWGQIVTFQQSALLPAAAVQNFAAYLKLRYQNPETRPIVALVIAPDIEGGKLMAPQYLSCYLEAVLKCQVFDNYVSALDWVESEISQFSTRLEWKDSFKIGDNDIDEQHRELFKRATNILAATSHEGQVISAMRLFQYMRTHLSHEEELMRRLHYPNVDAHTQEHRELIARLNTISLTISNEHLVKADLEEFLGDWFLRHMETADTDLARFANLPK
jgi:hemerythrin